MGIFRETEKWIRREKRESHIIGMMK